MQTFSIITPSLNQGAFLGECLLSVREAALRAGGVVEHFVMDGGSTDNTLKILRAQDHVKWISESDQGQTDAINKGILQSSGDIISYLCADDLLDPNSLALVQKAFASHPEADVVYGDAYFLEEGWQRRKHAGQLTAQRLRRKNFLLQPAVFLKREVFEKHGLFDTTLHFCMDHEYWLRICNSTRWTYVPETLASCRLYAHTKTWSQLPRAWQEARRMQSRYGLYWRPLRDALWMCTLGCHYYRLKRNLIARIAPFQKK